MPPKGKKSSAKINKSSLFKEEKVPPTAVIVAENVESRFEPLTSWIPHCLLPLANVPLLQFSLSRVIADGFLQIIIYACRHSDKIQHFIDSNRYAKRVSGLTISVFNGAGSRCMGDIMRDLESNQLLRGVEEFVLLSADVVCDVNLGKLLTSFKEQRKRISTSVLGLVLTSLPTFVSTDSERLVVVYNMPDRKLSQFIRHDRDVPVTCCGELFSTSSKNATIEIRSRLLDPRILLCSNHVPPLFQDNFDYDSIDDLVHGLLTNEEIMNYTIHLNFIQPEKVALSAAPTLMHLIEITPHLLTRMGSSLIRPPEYLFTDAFPRLSQSFCDQVLKGGSRHPPVAVSLTCYVSRSARIHPSARLIGSCMIGEKCHVGENVCLINTCLGEDCTVDEGSRLRNVVCVSNVYIGRRVVADIAWICPHARILDGVRLGRKCFIGAPTVVSEALIDDPEIRGFGLGVCLGPDATLPSESIFVAPGANDILLPAEECGSKGWATSYQVSDRKKLSLSTDDKTSDNEASSDADNDSIEETEVLLWRAGWSRRMRSSSRSTSRLYSGAGEDLLTAAAPSTERARARSKSGGDFEEESERDDGDASDEFLSQELQKTLQRSMQRQQSADVIILEINSLKHAYNISLEDLFFFLIKAMLDLAWGEVKSTKSVVEEKTKEFVMCFKRLVTQFSDVLLRYLSSSETGSRFCLQAIEDHACYHPHVLEASQWLIHTLYDKDLVTEETILWWVKESPLLADEDLAEQTRALRVKIAPFLDWLNEAEEEDEDSDNQ